MNRIIAIIISLWYATAIYSFPLDTNFHYPKYEVRAVWLTTIGGLDWPHSYARTTQGVDKQKKELTKILDKLKRANVNTVLIQTRIRATTIYASNLEPWDGCLSGKPGTSPGYDALDFAIKECHKRGMECHAWIVTIPVGKWNGTGCVNLRRTKPRLLRRIGDEGYMNPEYEGTATYIAGICKEITQNYDVDGIHLDYIRYPENWKITVSHDKGREYITRIVRYACNTVKRLKPWVKMSCSPIGKYSDLSRYSSRGWNAYDKVCQDAQGWLKEGLMDQLYPMMYFRGNQFYPFAADWAENSNGRTVVPGLGIYFLDPREGNWTLEDVTREIHASRQLGLGHAYFRSKFFTDNIRGIYDFVYNNADLYPALVPPMKWITTSSPTSPHDLDIRYGSETLLKWTGDAPYYNIYSSCDYPVDINDARNLTAQRVCGNSVTIKSSAKRFYAITAMDRYGNESLPLQSYNDMAATDKFMLKHDNKTLKLPDYGSALDAEYVTIETLQGGIIATKRYEKSGANIANIGNGIYTVRTLNKKGISHKLGYFIIRR